MERLLGIGDAAQTLGVSITTLAALRASLTSGQSVYGQRSD